ncbi:MAG: MoaD/ThiS family protein [Planctomycetota bacterium]|jgi:molybdopterin converting factor small subunit
MRIELFGIARARAGTGSVDVEAATLGEALRELAAVCPDLVPEVICDGRLTDSFLASLNDDAFIREADTPIGPRDTLLVLGAQAGG